MDRSNVYNMRYDEFLNVQQKKKAKFDIVFLDPPYDGDELSDAISRLERGNLVSDGGIIVAETENENVILPGKFREADVRTYKYGKIFVHIIRLPSSENEVADHD